MTKPHSQQRMQKALHRQADKTAYLAVSPNIYHVIRRKVSRGGAWDAHYWKHHHLRQELWKSILR